MREPLTPQAARDLRTRAKLTQRQLADELAYGSGGQVLVSQQETGVVGLSPSTAKLWRIVCERRIEAARDSSGEHGGGGG